MPRLALFSGRDSTETALGEGMARSRNREYRPSARAFYDAPERRPDFPEAETNRDIAWADAARIFTELHGQLRKDRHRHGKAAALPGLNPKA